MKYQGNDLAQFAKQIRYALTQYKPHNLSTNDFDNVVLCGLGGSGIAGRIVRSYIQDNFPLPVEVVSEYELPAYVNYRTLAIMCSYSGNTEETLGMYNDAKSKGATIIGIATGGTLKQKIDEDENLFYLAESGFQPRMALGYSLSYLLLIFGEFLGWNAKADLEKASQELANVDTYKQEGKEIFERIKDIFPRKIVVIADKHTAPVGTRFCQQLQENTKAEAFLHELPESNHNVIESYYGKLDTIFLFLQSNGNSRTGLRFHFLQELLERNNNRIIRLNIESDSILSYLRTIYILDWVSLWLSDYKGVNSSDIQNINALKNYLTEHKEGMPA